MTVTIARLQIAALSQCVQVKDHKYHTELEFSNL